MLLDCGEPEERIGQGTTPLRERRALGDGADHSGREQAMSDTSDGQVSTMGFDDFYEAGVRTIDDLTPEEVAALGPKSLGSLGEVLAACYLDARGYEVLEHNYRFSQLNLPYLR